MNAFRDDRILRTVRPVVVVLGGALLTSCTASRLMLRHGDLETNTEMSQSVFLELRSDLPPTVFVSEGSTAGRDLTVLPTLHEHLRGAGYTVVETAEQATYIMQINHLSLVEFELSGDQTLGDALGSALAAGATGALAADVLGASDRSVAGVGLAVGVIGFIVDASTKHMAHTLTTDVLITEVVAGADGEAEYKHETRIVSGASKVNLNIEESLPAIIQSLGASLSGLFPRLHAVTVTSARQ